MSSQQIIKYIVKYYNQSIDQRDFVHSSSVQYYITSCMYVVSQNNCEQINDDNEKYSTCCTVCYGMLMEGGRDKQSSRKAVVLVVVVLESHIYNTLYRLVSR
ncbi:MAG: hypothetical protein ACI90V_010176 [Bacillariaceae sp.]|jgi:hypothetical protein